MDFLGNLGVVVLLLVAFVYLFIKIQSKQQILDLRELGPLVQEHQDSFRLDGVTQGEGLIVTINCREITIVHYCGHDKEQFFVHVRRYKGVELNVEDGRLIELSRDMVTSDWYPVLSPEEQSSVDAFIEIARKLSKDLSLNSK